MSCSKWIQQRWTAGDSPYIVSLHNADYISDLTGGAALKRIGWD
jgi:hypothetical protein